MDDKRDKEIVYSPTAESGIKGDSILSGVNVVATTAAGLGVGLIGASLAVASLAAVEVVLPALLCLKAGGLLGGGCGLVFGVNSARKRMDKKRSEMYK